MDIIKDKNIVSCLLRRQQQGTLFIGEHNVNVLHRYAERVAASQSNKYVKCDLPRSTKSTFLIAFSPDGTRLASTHGDHTVRIVDLKTVKCTEMLIGHPRTPWSIAFHPSKKNLLASGCLGGEVRVWDLTRGDSAVYQQSSAIASLVFHPTDMVLLVATDNQLLFWNWEQPTPFACIDTPCKREQLRLVKFDPLGHHILTGIRNLPEVFQSPATRSDRTVVTGNALFNSYLNIARNQSSNGINRSHVTANLNQPPIGHGTSTSTVLHHYRSSAEIIGPSSRLLSGVSSSQVTEVQSLNTSLGARIDQVFADTFAEDGRVAMAANMTDTTYRLQLWDFIKLEMPKLGDPESNVIVPWCKLHNDASTDISLDGRLLCAFVPNVHNTAEFGNISVFSLESYNLGQCLFSKKFGPSAISVSFSPLGNYILVGLASARWAHWNFSSTYRLVAQVYKLNKNDATMELVSTVNCPVPVISSRPVAHHVSTNAAFWNPVVGSGLVYGTNRGEIYLCYTNSQSD